ncbi:cytochrome P450 [Artomyces pyxidatus]|uniref:Cytochrome P450 n=1 Tax=Artomyces pyxidatus TaxID=48021 RepID=A0ACB8TLB9_9AGAM|nr:cytochrome P450 [Artomyces pyxidatus]
MAITSLDVLLAGVALYLVRLFLTKKPLGPIPPGPKGLPILGNALEFPQTEQWKTFSEWGNKYGGIVYANALGQPIIILNDVNIAADMLEKKSSMYSDRPILQMAGELVGWKDTLVLTRYGERFKEYRKYFHSVMGTRASIEKLYGLFESETRLFLRRMLWKPEELADNIRKTAGGIILQVTYGYKPKEGSDSLVDLVDVAIHQFSELTEPNAYLVDLFPALRYVPSWFPGASFKKTAASNRRTLQEMAAVPLDYVRKQMAAGTASPSLASNLLEAKHTPEQEINIKWATASMYSAGADTTVSAVHTLYLAMTLYPETQRKAQAEIDAVVGSDRLPTFSDRPNLPYVEALFSETLRWGTVAPLGVPHIVSADDIHDGYFIPKGTVVMTNIKHMLHDPAVYSNPWEFDPERFIASEGKPAELDPRKCCFGFGRRICPGLNLADATVWLSMVMSLAVFNVSKKVVNGVEISPEPAYTDGTIRRASSHPAHFVCTIKPRSAKAEAMILSD